MPQAFARNTFLGFVSGAAVAPVGFIGTAIAARLLGPGGMGVIAYAAWCVMVTATIAGSGITLMLQRFIPNLRAEGKHDEAEGLIGASSRVSLLAAIVASLLLLAWLYWPGRSAMEAPAHVSRLLVIALILAWFIASNMAAVYLAYLKGEQRFDEFARLSVFAALVRVLFTVLGAWLFGVAGALAAYVAAYVVQASPVPQLLRKKPRVDRELKRHVIRFALAGWAGVVISGLVWGRTEIAFLEHYKVVGAVGLFAAALTLTEMAAQLPELLLSALLPYLSEQQGLGAQEQIYRLYRMVTGILALLVVPLCIGIAATAPVIVPLLFGAKFAAAAPVATVLLIAAPVAIVGATASKLIYSTGKSGLLLVSNALGLAGTVALGLLVIPRFGLMGAAWSRAGVHVSVVAIEIWYVARRLGFTLPYRAFGAITVAALASGAVAYVLSTGLGGPLSLALAVPAAIAVYVVALRTFRVLPMVEPALVDSVIEHAPRRVRRLVSWIL